MNDRPRVVAIGGGHGLAATLEAVRRWTGAITAIVSVADDGGSSGRLRRDLGIIAPGDLRRCLEALADRGPLTHAIGHRFARGELEGHPPGNVLLAALLEQIDDPVAAIEALADAMGVGGRVLPASVEPVDLVARTASSTVSGQVAVSATRDIVELGWQPARPAVPPATLDAIAQADLVVVGPGSLYTSVLAALVPDVRDAVAHSSARVVYVANLSNQQAETAGYSVSDHVDAVVRHGIVPDVVLVDELQRDDVESSAVEVVRAALRASSGSRHDIGMLGDALERYAAVTVSPNQDQIP